MDDDFVRVEIDIYKRVAMIQELKGLTFDEATKIVKIACIEEIRRYLDVLFDDPD